MKKSSGTELEAMMENKKQLEERFKEVSEWKKFIRLSALKSRKISS